MIRYVPDRLTEGYGLNIAAVEQLAESGVKLIVTVDNGVSAVKEAARAKNRRFARHYRPPQGRR